MDSPFQEFAEVIELHRSRIGKHVHKTGVIEKDPMTIIPLVRYHPLAKTEEEAKKLNIHTKEGFLNVREEAMKEQKINKLFS